MTQESRDSRSPRRTKPWRRRRARRHTARAGPLERPSARRPTIADHISMHANARAQRTPTTALSVQNARVSRRAAIRARSQTRRVLSLKSPAVREPGASEYVDPSQFTELELTTSQMTAYASRRPIGHFQSRFADDEPRKGADILVEALEREGVDCVFAYPGGASMEIHQSLTKSVTGIRNVLCRHEQGEVFAAEGVRKVHREGWGVHRDERAGGDEFGHRVSRRVVGFGADGGDHRAGSEADDRYGRVSGDANRGDHETDHQAQLFGDER